MMFGEVFRVIGKKVQAKFFSRFLAKNHEQTPWELGQNLKFPKSFCIGKTSREMMFGEVFGVIGKKVQAKFFSRFLAKNHEQTTWELGQNFKLPKIFCIGKTSREMMFGEVFSVIGNKVEEKCFSRFLAKNHEQTPWEFCQNFKFPKSFCIGKTSREMMFAEGFRVIGNKVQGKCFSPFLA